jgi:hypothetical protein
MTERSAASGFHMQISKLLIICVIAATAATSALVIELLVGMPEMAPGPGPDGVPPRPPELRPLAVLTVVTGLFVLAWLAVLVVFARDQVLARIRELSPPGGDQQQLSELLGKLRTELAADRERDLRVLDERITDYGERRETDGYLHGMRAATAEPTVEANVRSFRRPPPQR